MSIECDMSRVPHSRVVQCGVLLDSLFEKYTCRVRSTKRIARDQANG